MSARPGESKPFTGTSCWPVLPAASDAATTVARAPDDGGADAQPAAASPAEPGPPEAGIVLAGGRGSRLGGLDKAGLEVDGAPLIEHALAALGGCSPLIVVGPDHVGRPGVTTVREEPPLGGPAAAVVAGLAALPHEGPERVWLLACDLPRAEELVELLCSALAERPLGADEDGAIVRDAGGREQWLAGLYRVERLRQAAAALGDPEGAPLRGIVGGLRLRTVTDTAGAAVDLDTWEDVRTYTQGRGAGPQSPPQAQTEPPHGAEA